MVERRRERAAEVVERRLEQAAESGRRVGRAASPWSVSLPNRSSRPKTLRPPTSARTIKRIIALRRQRLGRTHRTPCLPASVFPDQKTHHSALAHLKAALAYYRRLGVTVKRVMTDTVAEPAEAMGRAIPLTPWFGQAHQPSPPLANNSASNTSELNPIRPEPTARPNASSKPPCMNGPMPELIKPQNNAPRTCHYGHTGIIGIDPIAA